MSNKSLSELPIELLHLIFNHLDTQTILYSLRPVCTQLYAAVKTYNKLNLNFSSFSIADSKFIANFIQPENVISLTLTDNDTIQSFTINLFFSLFQLHKFTRLQALTLVEMNDTALEQFFQNIITCRLMTLSITLPHQTARQTQKTISLLSSTVAQFSLQNLHLNISNVKGITEDILQSVQSVLRHLIISNCTYHEYHVILCCCPHLRTLVMGNCLMKNINQTVLPSLACTSYPQLTSLTLHRSTLSIDELHSLLSLTPSLVYLKVISQKSEFTSIFAGRLWKQFIETKLLFLKTFEFFFIYRIDEDECNRSLDSIITPYRTPFWLNDKHWFVTCDYVLTSSDIILYTIPIYTADFEVLIRYDPLSLNDCYRILTRSWSNHPEYVYTEQTLTTLDLPGTKITYPSARYLASALQNNTILTTLKLQRNTMTVRDIQYIANALENNMTLTTLYLEYNNISGCRAQFLINALKNNTTLTTLNLGHNRIGPSDAKYFEDMLQENTTLIDLNIQYNEIGDKGAQSIVNGLNKNRTLKILSLEQNEISGLGAKFLAAELKSNRTLITLDLQSNIIGDEGMKYFADALQNNTALTTLILAYNQIGSSGTKYLADALENNNTLTTIDLRANRIGPLGAKHLSDVLRKNTALTTLYLRDNKISPLGGEYFADMLRNNTTLTTLILENNQIEDQDTKHLAKALQDNMTLKALDLAQNTIRTTEAEHIAVTLRSNMILTALDIQENNSIDKSIMDVIDELLERNKKLLEENI